MINAADSDHPYVVTTILAIEGTGKKFVHTSGSSIVVDIKESELLGVVGKSKKPRDVPVLR